jgi:hypothetical protein
MPISKMSKVQGLLAKTDEPSTQVTETKAVQEKKEETSKPKGKGGRPKTMKQVVVWIPLTAYKQMRRIAFDEETSQQKLHAEALNMLFTDRNKPPIA